MVFYDAYRLLDKLFVERCDGYLARLDLDIIVEIAAALHRIGNDLFDTNLEDIHAERL